MFFKVLTKVGICWHILLVVAHVGCAPVDDDHPFGVQSIYISINPKNHQVDVNWFNIDLNVTGEPSILVSDGNVTSVSMEEFLGASRWILNEGVELLFDLAVNTTDGNQQTHLKHNFGANRRLDLNTGCYNYWYYLVVDNLIIESGCLTTRSYWMDEMRDHLESKKVRQLFLPGTHDSASYKYNFDPTRMETLITRYTLTQDDDIMSQLVHGIRYLDIRVGYYRSNEEKFWANHGISRLHPLSDILRQVKEFVDATNEIVILDVQEFPVGFGKTTEIHKQLAFFLFQQLEHYAADPELTWDATLGDIWRSGKRIVIGYDHYGTVQNTDNKLLWQSVQQRWGKVKDNADQLEEFLKQSRANNTRGFQTSRPFAEMAELTPEAVDVLTNRYGGLRPMADRVNWQVSKLYSLQNDFGYGANIVAIDYYLATNIIESAINWNKRKLKIKGTGSSRK